MKPIFSEIMKFHFIRRHSLRMKHMKSMEFNLFVRVRLIRVTKRSISSIEIVLGCDLGPTKAFNTFHVVTSCSVSTCFMTIENVSMYLRLF